MRRKNADDGLYYICRQDEAGLTTLTGAVEEEQEVDEEVPVEVGEEDPVEEVQVEAVEGGVHKLRPCFLELRKRKERGWASGRTCVNVIL
jgi:hypothetical protein